MNTNCLENMRCPNCGSYEPFAIEISAFATVYDDGFGSDDISMGHIEWHDDHHCICAICDFEGNVKQFRIRR